MINTYPTVMYPTVMGSAASDSGGGADSNVFITVGYTPLSTTIKAQKNVSLVKQFDNRKSLLLSDPNLCILPANSIIDSIEFYGNNLETKGVFNIGFGQLNENASTLLINRSTAAIANERQGGCRFFVPSALDGSNDRIQTLFDTPVNVCLEHSITCGSLKVVIKYHPSNM